MTRPFVSTAARRAHIAALHQLSGTRFNAQPATRPAKRPGDLSDRIIATVGALVALHSSDPATVYLSLLSRLPSATVEAISDVLYERRDLVRVHGMRRTLWVASIPVATDIVAASADRLQRAARGRLGRFLEETGVTDDGAAWIAAAEAELAAYVEANGPCDTRAIGEALPHLTVGFEGAPGKPYSATIAAHTRLLVLLGCQGRILRGEPLGTWIASQYRWVTPERWLGRPILPIGPGDHGYGEVEREAQRSIIARYVDRFGPVTETDIAWWTGWPLGVTRRALAELDAVEVDLEETDEPGWMSSVRLEEITDTVHRAGDQVAVLPGLDPTTMGWKQRQWYLADDVAARLFDRNGNGGPAVWVNGRIVGGWAQRDDGTLVHRLVVDVSTEATGLIEAELDRLAERIGDTTFKVRFPSPLNKELRR